MTWGQIKKAINSTLGTKDFQPLNEIFSNGIQKLKEAISNGTLICGKSKVLNDDSFELETSEKMIEYNQALESNHQGVDGGTYLVEYSFVSFWDGRNSTVVEVGIAKVSQNKSDAIPISYSGASVDATLTITEESLIVRVAPVYTASSGYINSELKYIKIKKIF